MINYMLYFKWQDYFSVIVDFSDNNKDYSWMILFINDQSIYHRYYLNYWNKNIYWILSLTKNVRQYQMKWVWFYDPKSFKLSIFNKDLSHFYNKVHPFFLVYLFKSNLYLLNRIYVFPIEHMKDCQKVWPVSILSNL